MLGSIPPSIGNLSLSSLLLSVSLMSLDSAAQSVDTRRSAPQQAALDFSAISDGGYHPGYWRTKYAKKT